MLVEPSTMDGLIYEKGMIPMETISNRKPSHRGAVNRTKLRAYYKVYVKEDEYGGLYYKLLEVVKAAMPPKEEVHLRETRYGEQWYEYIDVYESKREYLQNVAIIKREGGKELK